MVEEIEEVEKNSFRFCPKLRGLSTHHSHLKLET